MKVRLIFLFFCLNSISNLYAQEDNSKKKILPGDSIYYRGNYNFQKSNYPEALKDYFEALKIYKEYNNQVRLANTYNNIGTIYCQIDNFSEALKYYLAALQLKQETHSKNLDNSYNNIGVTYLNLGNYDEAIKNHLLALELSKKDNDTSGIAITLSSLGNVCSKQTNYKEALNNYLPSLELFKVLNDTLQISGTCINIGETYLKLNEIKKASAFFYNALELSSKANIKDHIKNCYYNISVIDSMQNRWPDAYKNYRLYTLYKDSIDNEESKSKILQLTLKNEFDAKEAQQKEKETIMAAEKKNQNLILLFVSGMLILVAAFAIVVARSLRLTRKQKDTIELQKNEVSHQKELLAHKNKEVTDSINYAQRIQKALLASDKVLNENLNKNGHDTPSYFIFFQPKDIVSGDFYWAVTLKNRNFALVTADSTGHGVPGAIMSMLNIACLNEAVNGKQLTEPNEILDYTRTKIIENLTNDGSAEGGKDGMDCSIIVFEESTGILKYAAANNPVWIVRQEELIELLPDKMPVGKHERDKIPFSFHTQTLQTGDVIYTITDGMPDQFGGPKDKKYMSKQLKELLKAISALPMDIQKQKIAEEFNSWKGKAEQVDDVTIIGIRI